jgi:hypothetical protein
MTDCFGLVVSLYFMVEVQQKMKKRPGPSPFQWHAPNVLKPPIRLHPLKVPPPPKNTTLETKPLIHGLWGHSKYKL